MFWDTRLRRRLDYATVVVCVGTQESEEDLVMRLFLFLGGTRDGYGTIAFFIFGTRDSEKDLTIQLLLFVLNARLSKRLDYETVVVCFGTRDSAEDYTMQLLYLAVRLLFFFWGDARL